MSPSPSFTPKPLYSCSADGCADENTYPPEMLWWIEGKTLAEWLADAITVDDRVNMSGWYCENCLWWWAADDWADGVVWRLDKWQQAHRVPTVCLCGRRTGDRPLADGECECGRGVVERGLGGSCRHCWIEDGYAEAADQAIKSEKELCP